MRTIIHVDPDISDLIPGYLENRVRDGGEFRAWLERGEFEKIKALAHKIRGSAKGYGFEGLTVIAARLEELAGKKDLEQIRAELLKYNEYLDSIELIDSQ